MPLAGFEAAAPANDRPQTYALDRVASGKAIKYIAHPDWTTCCRWEYVIASNLCNQPADVRCQYCCYNSKKILEIYSVIVTSVSLLITFVAENTCSQIRALLNRYVYVYYLFLHEISRVTKTSSRRSLRSITYFPLGTADGWSNFLLGAELYFKCVTSCRICNLPFNQTFKFFFFLIMPLHITFSNCARTRQARRFPIHTHSKIEYSLPPTINLTIWSTPSLPFTSST
jgi:hypothetical protein